LRDGRVVLEDLKVGKTEEASERLFQDLRKLLDWAGVRTVFDETSSRKLQIAGQNSTLLVTSSSTGMLLSKYRSFTQRDITIHNISSKNTRRK